jgi:hypothetical protein
MNRLFALSFFIIFSYLSSCTEEKTNNVQKTYLSLGPFVKVANKNNSNYQKNLTKKDSGPSLSIDSSKVKEAIAFCKKQKLDTGIAFFADMSIHSGKKRFFVFDLQNKKILHSGLCCHGLGMGSTCESPVFSNVKGSNCTSLGKYKTGERSYSNWGINVHYKMHGLENTNNNAFSRIVVLHSYDPIADEEIYPDHLPMGWSQGCPVISNKLMTSIDSLLKNRKRPVLLWIYN